MSETTKSYLVGIITGMMFTLILAALIVVGSDHIWKAQHKYETVDVVEEAETEIYEYEVIEYDEAGDRGESAEVQVAAASVQEADDVSSEP